MFQTGHSKVGGRKKGSKNKKTLMAAEAILVHLRVNPIEKLVDIAESNESSIEQKIRCWQEVAKYTYPKLKSQEIYIEPEPVEPIKIHFVSPDGTVEKL